MADAYLFGLLIALITGLIAGYGLARITHGH